MEYREFAPRSSLAPFVDRLWTLTGNAREPGGGAQPVLPDGRPELVVHFGDPFERLDERGRGARQARVLLAGQLTAQLSLRPTGVIGVLGVRFHPFGASAFVGHRLHEMTGLTIGIEDVSPAVARAIARVRSRTDGAIEAVPFVEAALERCVDARPVDARVRFATERIVASRGRVSIDALARQASVTRRHLERRFLESVGIPPKRLARIARFQAALRALQAADPDRAGTIAAAACGYADQSHFIREFRELAGCAPSAHLVHRAEMTGFFVTGGRASSSRA
jgi:AraC-like DNA-binding protein